MVCALPVHALAGILNVEVGGAFTVTDWVLGPETQPAVVTLKLTCGDPALLQFTLCGPTVLAVAGLAPAPKFHAKVDPTGAFPV